MRKVILAALFAATIGIVVFEVCENLRLRREVETLRQQEARLTDQIEQLKRENNEAVKEAAVFQEQSKQATAAQQNLHPAETTKLEAQAQREFFEASKLRAELGGAVGRLRSASGRFGDDQKQGTNILNNIALVKQYFEQMPEKKIPELQLLNDVDWLEVFSRGYTIQNIDSDAGLRRAMSEIRSEAKRRFAMSRGGALDRYAKANGGQLPTDIFLLKNYFNPPADDAILERYQVIQTGSIESLVPNQTVVAEKAPADDQFDMLYQIGLCNYTASGTGRMSSAKSSGSWGNRGATSPMSQEANSIRSQSKMAQRQMEIQLKVLGSRLTPQQLEAYRQKRLEEFQKAEETASLLESFGR